MIVLFFQVPLIVVRADEPSFILGHQLNEEELIHEVYYPFLTTFGFKNINIYKSSQFSSSQSLFGYSLNLEKKLAYIGLRVSGEIYFTTEDCTGNGASDCNKTETDFNRFGFLVPFYLYSTQNVHFAIGTGTYSGHYNMNLSDSENLPASTQFPIKKDFKMLETFLELRFEKLLLSVSRASSGKDQTFETWELAYIGNF